MAIVKKSHTRIDNPIDPNVFYPAIFSDTDGIIIDIITNIGGDEIFGKLVWEQAPNSSYWIKIEFNKKMTLLPARPTYAPNTDLRSTYTNWMASRCCLLYNEVCFLVYSDPIHRNNTHRIFPFDGYEMQDGDFIVIEINESANIANIYYPQVTIH